jgi:hypothetical protein
MTLPVLLTSKGLQPIFHYSSNQRVSIRFWCHPHPVYNLLGEDDTELVRSWSGVRSWELEIRLGGKVRQMLD